MFKTVRERKVKFALCAEGGLGKLHFMNNGTMCWRGRQWSQSVLEECPEADGCRKCLQSLAAGWTGGDVQVSDFQSMLVKSGCTGSPKHFAVLALPERHVSDECRDGLRLRVSLAERTSVRWASEVVCER